jgi:hypothetical protein
MQAVSTALFICPQRTIVVVLVAGEPRGAKGKF